MDVTSVIELVLAILLFLLALTTTKRIGRLEDTVYALTGENEELQKKLDALTAKKEAEQTAETPKTEAVEEAQPAPAPVEAAPEPAVPAQPAQPAPTDSLTPDVVAVIMATIAAYGYSPAAIRSIRPTQTLRRGQNWVMAGRLANMR